MIVGIDIRFLARGKRTGIEEYALNLIPELVKQNSSTEFKFFYNAFRKEQLEFEWLKAGNCRLFEFRMPNRFMLDPLAKFLRQPKLDKLMGGADVFFSPHFLLSPVSERCKKIITFHDLSFEYFPEFFPRRKRFWHYSLNLSARAREAQKIIAVSQSTQNDLVDLYRIPQNKVETIHLGVGDEFKRISPSDPGLELVRRKYSLPEKFILFFGTIEPRKNLAGLIKAYEIFRQKAAANADYRLVIAGNKGWLCSEIFQQAKNSVFSSDIKFTGFIEPDEKVFLYNLASLFVFPSFFEGFGFPPLEAMACGVPVIVSNNSSFPETSGQGGLMVDPYNSGEIAWAMEEILKDERLSRDLAEKGFLCAKKFSWKKCAMETMGVIKSVL